MQRAAKQVHIALDLGPVDGEEYIDGFSPIEPGLELETPAPTLTPTPTPEPTSATTPESTRQPTTAPTPEPIVVRP